MNYGFSLKNTRMESSTTKNTFRFTIFVAFSLWLLYQILQSYTKMDVTSESISIHFKNERIFNIFGRKGRVAPLKLTHRVHSYVILDDVTNPGQLNDDKDATFNGVDERESIATEVLTMKSNYHEFYESEDGANRFYDENGIPELVREKLVVNESTQSSNETSV